MVVSIVFLNYEIFWDIQCGFDDVFIVNIICEIL